MSQTKIDNKQLPLAKRYSDAIISVAQDRNEVDDVFADIKNVSECLSLVEKMKMFLVHPVIPVSEKKDMISSIFKGKIKESSLNLLLILLEKNRFNILDTIKYCYENAMDDAKNVIKVSVVSAVEIDEDLKEKLQKKLEKKLSKSVKFEFEINPAIIAGLILKIQDKTIDGSLASRLEGFKKTLIINGVGYRASKQGNKLVLNIGYSIPSEVVEIDGIKLNVIDNNKVEVSGINKELVGQMASKIRDLKPVEPYHAYGIRYEDEVVIRKEGKKAGKK